MRSSKSRNRNKNNRRPSGNIVNRVFDSSGPEGKVRGTPQQIIEKYTTLARDAQLAGDRVAVENFQQHAEHYTRMLGEAMREIAEQQRRQQEQQDAQQAARERDRERKAERNESAGGSDEQAGAGAAPTHEDAGAEAAAGSDANAGPVETPEDPGTRKPRQPRSRRPRTPKREAGEAGAEDSSESPSGDQPSQAAE